MGKAYFLPEEEYNEFTGLFPETRSLDWIITGDSNSRYYEIHVDDIESKKDLISRYDQCLNYLHSKPSYDIPEPDSEPPMPEITAKKDVSSNNEVNFEDSIETSEKKDKKPAIDINFNIDETMMEDDQLSDRSNQSQTQISTLLKDNKKNILFFLILPVCLAWIGYSFFSSEIFHKLQKSDQFMANIYLLDILEKQFVQGTIVLSDGNREQIYPEGYTGSFNKENAKKLELDMLGYELAEENEYLSLDSTHKSEIDALIKKMAGNNPIEKIYHDKNRKWDFKNYSNPAIFYFVKSSKADVKIRIDKAVDCDVAFFHNRFPKNVIYGNFRNGYTSKIIEFQREQKYKMKLTPISPEYLEYQKTFFYHGEDELVINVYKDYLSQINQMAKKPDIKQINDIYDDIINIDNHPQKNDIIRLKKLFSKE